MDIAWIVVFTLLLAMLPIRFMRRRLIS